ncbi:hypothetical protein P6P90_00835 [Ectobacillus antri]|uniref:Uncharacterized protein n=1 Tax=Ectobacillus antri TaxID=2486280 RepID=A0ABT6H0S8_9BACI|nr:hypothetical protein [Ectobacillus antri]MDG4655870.1 hypothetical protein [Ectobacillus antri]MDG5752545.1 hypothetical protein [Ectobacillus antri]
MEILQEIFNEEEYIKELIVQGIKPSNHYLMELLITLKKYEGNQLIIEANSDEFVTRNTINNYQIEVVLEEHKENLVLRDGSSDNVFMLYDWGMNNFRRIYEKFPNKCFVLEYKKKEINLKITK